MDPVYDTPAVLDTLGTSDHRMVLLKPSYDAILNTGNIQRAVVRRFTANEKAAFASALSDVSWEHLYTMTTCEEQFNFFQRTMEELMVTHFPYKSVTRHTADKPWVTDYFRHLIRQRQRAIMSGDIDEARRLRNLVNRTAPKLRQRFYQSKIATLEETSSNDWWKHMKNLMGAPSGNTNEMQGLANKCTEGDMTQLVNSMNDFFVSVSADLPRLDPTHRVFDIEEPLPAEFTIEAASTQRALQNVKCRKATGPDNIPPWMVKNYAHLLAAPVTAIFNSSLREGKLPDLWKTATIVPVPKKHPPGSLENDIRPISLTPILAKVFEGIVLNWVDDVITPQIDERQFGGLAGTGTTDALVEMVHTWCEATTELYIWNGLRRRAALAILCERK